MNRSITESYNLADQFVDRHIREGRGARRAVICGDSSLSYAEVAALVNRVGNGLLRVGVQEEQRVLLILPDSPEFVAAYFGVMKMGAVAVPASPSLRAEDYDYFLSTSRARVLIVCSSVFPVLASILGSQRYLRQVIIVGAPQDGYLSWDEWLDGSSPNLEPAPTSRDDVAFWLWTSGSTGRPKAAVHLHQDWISCCENYAGQVLKIGPEDITFSSSHLFHAYGLGNGLMFPFYAGASTVLFRGNAGAGEILETAQKNKITLLFSVPALYSAMLMETRQNYDLGSVRLAVSATNPLSSEIVRDWKKRFGIEILDGIGSTEVLHIYLSARPGAVRPGSTGQAVPGYELRIIDQSGVEVEPGAIGELLVAGESIAPYYWNSRSMTVNRMRGNWFYTGDNYRMDEQGFFWYAGRTHGLPRVSSQWVSPGEVANALMEHPFVLNAAVVPYKGKDHLETPGAFVILREGIAATPNLTRDLQDFVKERITPHRYPRPIKSDGDVSRTAEGSRQRSSDFLVEMESLVWRLL